MSTVRKINSVKVEKRQTVTHLKVVKSIYKPLEISTSRIDQFWIFCNAVLWPNQQFQNAEIKEYKKLIAEHFRNSRNYDKTFKQLIERVCLAKRYVARRKGRYISKPVDWLNINYKNGLAGTASWYKVVEKQRKTVPHYNEGIAKLSEAVLSYCIIPSLFDIRCNYKKLITLKQYDLVQLYVNTIMHMQYLN
jgi:hypothetical protein